MSAGKAVRSFRIQSQPHSCRTRSGSAWQAFGIGSSTSCLACRSGSTRPLRPGATPGRSTPPDSDWGAGRRHHLGGIDRLHGLARVAAGPVPDPAVDGWLLGPGSPEAGHLLALHVLLPRPPQRSRPRIEGHRHTGVGPADLHGLDHARTPACMENAHDCPPPISTRLKRCPRRLIQDWSTFATIAILQARCPSTGTNPVAAP